MKKFIILLPLLLTLFACNVQLINPEGKIAKETAYRMIDNWSIENDTITNIAISIDEKERVWIVEYDESRKYVRQVNDWVVNVDNQTVRYNAIGVWSFKLNNTDQQTLTDLATVVYDNINDEITYESGTLDSVILMR